MKYKVGDKVLIRSDLKADSNTHYGAAVVNNSMEKFIGKIVTISKVRGCRNEIEEDNGMWNWTDEMIERRTDMFTKDDLKVGYVVETKSQEFRMVIETQYGTVLAAANGSCINLTNYSNDLVNLGFSKHNIIRVYGFTNWPTQALRLSACDRPLLWERKEELLEITIEEIAKLKGVSPDRIRIKD